MDPLDNFIIEGILQTDANGIVLRKEDDRVEYKLIFDNGSKEAKAKYGKELAALYNFQGGYLIFGVDDTTNELVGLSDFVQPDNADLSNDINSYFSPAINFQSKLLTIQGKEVFLLYAPKRESIPTICIKTHQTEIKESTIYWRYSGQASPIKSGDLINLFNEVKGEENKKQTEIAEKNYRAQYRPKIFIRGTSKGQGEISVNIQNRGPVAIFESVEILEKNSDALYGPSVFPLPIFGDRIARLEFHGSERHYQQLEFQFVINYVDDEGFEYKAFVSCTRGKSHIEKIEEL